MNRLALLALAAAVAIGQPAGALASPKAEKVYAANGWRVAVIKDTAFGRSVYGRRVAVIRSR
ncbi:hypothetical protein MKK88_03350 [Methylobacterium sp. E-005]|uniref:hypothetical protein n=1 Tax=Methylobacterium sp. E-005 TaxID=2836549 RepID=UPI001FBA3D52|nr:hypothetical protein [Methylobacterium sp. E-005]MCJ2085032.1 hypothetical protein [Methylobacterium sp. E-005]